ncbi:MAG: M12 family metallo-peptidase [Pseudomonadota bacterium]
MRFPSRNAGALFLILVVLGAMMPATAAPLRLLQVRAAQLRSSAVAQSAQRSGEEPASLRLVVQAGNEQHVLMLRVNSHLGAWATAQQPAAVAFEGYLPGLTRSWVRVTRIGTRWTGVWFDGESYYGIDSARAVAATNADAAAAAPDSLVVFRLADVVSDGPVFAGDMVRPTFSGQELAQTVAAELQSPATAAALVATRRLSVGLIADAQLVTLDGPDVTTNMVARLDVVDGIFSSQLGVHMEAKSTTLLDATALSYTGTDPSQLLTSLRDYRGANTTQQAAGLSHLMTGRDMDGQTVGIAYLSDASKTPPSIALCSVRSSASLSEARRFVAYDALIMAHEMGHVFGAPHDGETDPAANQACAAEPTSFLMAGTISGSKTFSSCSLAQIAPVIEIAKSLPQCLTLIDADLSVAVTGDAASVLVGSDVGVTLTVRNLGNTDVSDAQLNITVPAGLTLGTVSATGINCAQSGTAVSCLPSALAINATASVRLTLHGATVGAAVVAAAISSSVSDSVASNNQSQVSISVSNVPVQPPNSGNSNSGGGAVGLELLGALLLLLISRKRWRRIA